MAIPSCDAAPGPRRQTLLAWWTDGTGQFRRNFGDTPVGKRPVKYYYRPLRAKEMTEARSSRRLLKSVRFALVCHNQQSAFISPDLLPGHLASVESLDTLCLWLPARSSDPTKFSRT